jgi:hypothetical protein
VNGVRLIPYVRAVRIIALAAARRGRTGVFAPTQREFLDVEGDDEYRC